MIYTDANGRPIEPPERPAPDASIEEKVRYLRARHAYNDLITDMANRAFAERFSVRS